MRSPDLRLDAELDGLNALSRVRPLTHEEADRVAQLLRTLQQRATRQRLRERRRRAALRGEAA